MRYNLSHALLSTSTHTYYVVENRLDLALHSETSRDIDIGRCSIQLTKALIYTPRSTHLYERAVSTLPWFYPSSSKALMFQTIQEMLSIFEFETVQYCTHNHLDYQTTSAQGHHSTSRARLDETSTTINPNYLVNVYPNNQSICYRM